MGVGVRGEVHLEPWVAEQRRLLEVEREAEVEEAIQTQVGWGRWWRWRRMEGR